MSDEQEEKDYGPASIGAMLGVIVGLCIHHGNSLEEDLIPWIGVMHDDALAQVGKEQRVVRFSGSDGQIWEVHTMMSLCVALYAYNGVGREDLFGLVRDLHADISNVKAAHDKAIDVETKFFGEKKRK